MQKHKTLEELQRLIQNKTATSPVSGIFEYVFKNQEGWEWLYPYCPTVDILLEMENGSLFLLPKFWWDYNTSDMIIRRLSKYLDAEMKKHKYELQTLIGTLDLEYNPIYNVEEDTLETYSGDGTNKSERKEQGEGSSKGKNTTDDITDTDYGAVTENTDTIYGSSTDTTKNTSKNEYGSSTDSTNTTNTNVYGATSGDYTTTNGVAPMDSSEFNNATQETNKHSEKSHTDDLTQTSTITNGSKTDNITQNATVTNGGRTDTESRNVEARRDTIDRVVDGVSSTSYANNVLANVDGVTTTSYTKHIIRKGNIGVTSAQELIKQQREIAKFSIEEVIIAIFISVFCIGIYEDTDSIAHDTVWED